MLRSKPENPPEKNPQSIVRTNKKVQSTTDAGSWIQTRARLVRVERSNPNHCRHHLCFTHLLRPAYLYKLMLSSFIVSNTCSLQLVNTCNYNWRGECKTMLSECLGKKKKFAKGPEFWQVGFVSPEKHCSEVFSLGCSSFSRNVITNVCKKNHTGWKNRVFFAYATGISRKRSELKHKNYKTLLNIPEKNCMRNLERFWQSLLLIKIANALFSAIIFLPRFLFLF